MLERLKSLPLTIALTLLIWLYAESQVRTAPENVTQAVSDVPVWVAGPPDIIQDYDVIVQPHVVSVTVTGTKERMEALDPRSIAAYLDITSEDIKSPAGVDMRQRALRATGPEGVTIPKPPPVMFQLKKKNAFTRP